MSHYLRLTPHDPIIARDGRPFNAGQRMKSLGWPYPSVLAGALRTLLGKLDGRPFEDLRPELRALAIASPLPVVNEELHFPAPADLLVREDNGTRAAFPVRPEAAAGCTKLPHEGLHPVMLPGSVEDFKPAKVAAFWSRCRMGDWLLDTTPQPAPPEGGEGQDGYLSAPDPDPRMHVKVEPDIGAADEGMLFRTIGLAVRHDMGLSMQVNGSGPLTDLLPALDVVHPFGGERRLTHWCAAQDADLWRCPQELRDALACARFVRLVLATPALFADGWKPGWIGGNLEGEHPEVPGLRLKLIGVCIDRWRPISGWDMETRKPKAIRRLVPAGGVYFLEVLANPEGIHPDTFWLRSLCDDPQDRRDGFGLALPGVWQGLSPKEAK